MTLRLESKDCFVYNTNWYIVVMWLLLEMYKGVASFVYGRRILPLHMPYTM